MSHVIAKLADAMANDDRNEVRSVLGSAASYCLSGQGEFALTCYFVYSFYCDDSSIRSAAAYATWESTVHPGCPGFLYAAANMILDENRSAREMGLMLLDQGIDILAGNRVVHYILQQMLLREPEGLLRAKEAALVEAIVSTGDTRSAE